MSELGANIFEISSNNSLQQFAKIGAVKVDYFDFPGEISERFV